MAKSGAAGEWPLTQLARVGLADDDGARGPQSAYHLGVPFGIPDVSIGAEPRGHAPDVDVVLDRDRNSQQRKFFSRRTFAVGLRRVRQRLLAQNHPERV